VLIKANEPERYPSALWPSNGWVKVLGACVLLKLKLEKSLEGEKGGIGSKW
jgi:hypothetical protein